MLINLQRRRCDKVQWPNLGWLWYKDWPLAIPIFIGLLSHQTLVYYRRENNSHFHQLVNIFFIYIYMLSLMESNDYDWYLLPFFSITKKFKDIIISYSSLKSLKISSINKIFFFLSKSLHDLDHYFIRPPY